jgi:hypothetical protein
LKKPTHLKIILRKKGKIKGINIGLCITKALPPTAPPASQIRKEGVDPSMQAETMMDPKMGKTGKSIKRSYKTTSMIPKKTAKEDNFPEIIPPTLENLERKLQILPNEWFKESMYKSEYVSCIYAYWKPTKGPFLIVPSLEIANYQAEYSLTVFSSNPVEIEKLEDSK